MVASSISASPSSTATKSDFARGHRAVSGSSSTTRRISPTVSTKKLQPSSSSKSFKPLSVYPNAALHEKLSSRAVGTSKSPAPARTTKDRFPLPNELILLVLDNLSDSALSVVRTVSRRWANLANVILVARFEAKIEPLAIAAIDAKRTLIESEVGQRHGLAHYKDFLRRIPPSDLSEAIWFASPPEEVRTICECLLRLKGISNDSSSGSRKSSSTQSAGPQPMPWKVIKKHMSQYDFKRWFLDLQVNVDFIPHRNIKFVEEIIMMAPDTINYDHVRSVSLAGYRLLILVAACLQYGCISEDLRTKKNRVLKIEKTLVNVQKFIDAICSHSTARPAIARAALA